MDVLRDSPEIELCGALDHRGAMGWHDEWQRVDVVILDAADEHRSGDQFPGVAVVRRIREAVPDRHPVVVVVTGHTLHDGLRHRMAKAQADLFFHRSDLCSAEELIQVVLHPERYRRGVPPLEEPERQVALGVGLRTDVDRLVEYVEEHGLQRALEPDAAIREAPRSRRWLRHRREMAKAAGIEPVNMTTGDRPRESDAPSIRQLSHLWAWAARIRRTRG